MAVFGVDTKLTRQPPEMTGAQGFGTPAAQQNAVVQGIGGSPSSPSSDAKGQSPADKLLAYASNFGAPNSLPVSTDPRELGPVNLPDLSNDDIVKQLFPGTGTGEQSPWSSTPSPGMGVLPGETPSDPNGGYVAPRFDPSYDPNTGVVTYPGTPPSSPPPAEPSSRTHPSAPPPVYSDANPPPHPPEGASLTDITNYYRKFAYKNPAFGNITEQDVLAYWRDPKGMQIGDWYLAGNRGVPDKNPLDGLGMEPPAPPTTPDPTTQPDPNGGYVAPRIQPSYDPNTGVVTYPGANVPPPASPLPTPPPVGASPGTPPPPAPPPAGGTPPPPPPAGGPPGPPAPWTPTWGDLGAAPDLPPIPMPDVSNDPWTQMLQKALGAQKDVADAQIRRSVTAAQAATGGLNMGGFGSAIATPIAEYNANLDKEGATELSAAHNSAMDRALQGSIAERQSQTQLQLGRMDVMSKKYSADQSLEGEKFRAQIDQAIGAAQNASAEKISTAVNAKDLQTARIAADSAAQIAASNAASGAAQAGASLAAQQYASDKAYQGTIQKIAQDRENSQLQYNLGITGIGNDAYKANLQNNQFMMALLQGLGPEQLAKYLFPNQQPPTPVYVQP